VWLAHLRVGFAENICGNVGRPWMLNMNMMRDTENMSMRQRASTSGRGSSAHFGSGSPRALTSSRTHSEGALRVRERKQKLGGRHAAEGEGQVFSLNWCFILSAAACSSLPPPPPCSSANPAPHPTATPGHCAGHCGAPGKRQLAPPSQASVASFKHKPKPWLVLVCVDGCDDGVEIVPL
jgi:hypothetical protein